MLFPIFFSIILKELLISQVGEEAANKAIYATTDPCKGALRQEANEKGYESVSAEVSMVPDTYSAVDKDTASKVQKLIDRLEEDDDVQNVYTNADFPEDFEG